MTCEALTATAADVPNQTASRSEERFCNEVCPAREGRRGILISDIILHILPGGNNNWG
mgnify:CR=1